MAESKRARAGLAAKPPAALEPPALVHGVRRWGGDAAVGGLGVAGAAGATGSFAAVHAHLSAVDARAYRRSADASEAPPAAITLGFKAATRPAVVMNGYNSTVHARRRAENGTAPVALFAPSDCSDVDVRHVLDFCKTTPIHGRDRAQLLRKISGAEGRRRLRAELADAIWLAVG